MSAWPTKTGPYLTSQGYKVAFPPAVSSLSSYPSPFLFLQVAELKDKAQQRYDKVRVSPITKFILAVVYNTSAGGSSKHAQLAVDPNAGCVSKCSTAGLYKI